MTLQHNFHQNLIGWSIPENREPTVAVIVITATNPMKSFSRIGLAFFSLAAGILIGRAATTTVQNLNDSGPGSLRAAVASASSGDTITFASTLSGGRIVLTSGEILLGKDLTIDGSSLSRSVQLDGNASSQILRTGVNTVSLKSLTFTNGNAYGGAIYSDEGSLLFIANCTFVGNYGYEGGAILNDGSLSLMQCTFSGNTGAYGGAIECGAPTTVVGCTFSGNSADVGGAIWNNRSTVVIENSVLAGNSPPAGGEDIASDFGALIYAGTNLIPIVYNDQPTMPAFGPSPLVGDPQLAPLGDYGGRTLSMPPRPGSPAIDAGAPALDEVQQISVYSEGPATFTLTFNEQTTSPISVDATAHDLQDALNALPIVAGSVVVTFGGNVHTIGGIYTIMFDGTLAGADQPQLVASSSDNIIATVITLVDGGPAPQFDQRGPGFARSAGAAPDLGGVEVQSQPSAGTYNGLFSEAGSISQESSGLFTARLTATTKAPFIPKYTAKINLAGKKYSVSGQFDGTGYASNSIPRHSLSPLTFKLFSAAGYRLFGRVSDGNWTADLSADRAMFDTKTNPIAKAYYTFYIPGGGDPAANPAGDGIGTIALASNGGVTIKGTLADGTSFAFKTALSQSYQWPLYISANAGKGSILSWIGYNSAEIIPSLFSSSLTWIRKADAGSSLYSAGFTNGTALNFASYAPPPPNTAIFPLETWEARFNGGDFDHIAVGFHLDNQNKISNVSDTTFSVTFEPATGFFSGKIGDPVTKKLVSYKGYTSQGDSLCHGFYLNHNQSGSTLLFGD